jgi:hypothetical protein
MFGGLEDVVRASSAPWGSKIQVTLARLCNFAEFHSALTTPSAETWMRSSYLRSGTVRHLSNLFLLDNESQQQLALTAVKQSNIASRFLFLRDAPAIRERYFKVCFRVRLPRNRMGMENAAPLVGDNLYVCQPLAQM